MPRKPAPSSESLSAQDLLGEGGALRRGPKQHTREHVQAIQRQRLLQATVATVSEVGYAGMTVAQVIERAGISRRTFYELFKDCDDCFLATFEWGLQQLSSLVTEAYWEEQSWRDGVRAALQTTLGFLDIERAWARLLVIEAVAAGGRPFALRVATLERVTAELESRRAEDDPGHEPLPLAGETIVGGTMWVIYLHLLERPQESLVDLSAPLMALMMLPYLDRSEARKELTLEE